MLKSHEKFYSTNGKRLILIADDEFINREILGEMLKDEYEIIFACDGNETMEMIHSNKDLLSLVLLDILMPGMTGLEILQKMDEEGLLAAIPVIVLTAEKETEVESLKMGASDFIPKPYPAADVIHARILRTIELSEDRDIIHSTERDSLTGLYNREYFYRYAEQYDQHHKDKDLDAVIVDVDHFHMINERYGKAYGDEVLRRIGEELRQAVGDSDGIVARQEADTFMVYCPHREDYEQILQKTAASITEGASSENRIRLRMGVNSCVDKSVDIERRFDHAKMAANTVRGSFTKAIGFYDEDLHKRELYAEQLIEDFPTAIREKQFKVFYQPKFDVRPDTPILASAEALVRWVHPELGMINPGIFISLFEQNGLIQKLDNYVWEETARQIREWKDRLGCSIPVSVNMSRIDMYDPELPNVLGKIIEDRKLTNKDLLLEVTESAYTQDSEQIIDMVNTLRSSGFKIEMDDFGTGYSSLNMISSLPIDALKLDMQFIREAFKEGGNTHMVEVIIGISDYLGVPVIAEGVETEEQLHSLKGLGCDLVQGYFFSKPVPAEDFEAFILQKKEADLAAMADPDKALSKQDAENEKKAREEKMNFLLKQHEEEDQETEETEANHEENVKEHTGIQLKTASLFCVIIAIIAAGALMASDAAVAKGYQRMSDASDRYIAAQMAATDLETGSDYLTDRVRCFVVTGEIEYLQDFIEEVEVTKTRDKAVQKLEKMLQTDDSDALDDLNTALALSNELVETENHAMRLMLETGDYDMSEVPDSIANVELTEEEMNMSDREQEQKAQSLVFDNNYMHYKDRIRENVNLCTQSLIRSSSQELENASARMALLTNLQTILSIIFLAIVLGIILIVRNMVRKPLTNMVLKMQNQETIKPTGVEELRFVTRIYNSILHENKAVRDRLSHEASHDALTGLFNRGAYDLLMESTDKQHMALILIDVDYFKEVNDTYGHAVGDRVLKRVAELMKISFRSVDILCRIGGDEFVVVMTRVHSGMTQLVYEKIEHMNDLLQHPKDDLPPVSLSVGVAFSDRENPQGDIFRDADAALYEVKESGRKGCKVFGDEQVKRHEQ